MSVDKQYILGKTFSTSNNPSRYCRVYSKNYEKAKALEFELDRSRDIIMKLKNDLLNKNKEIHLLKINKINIEEEHYKSLKTISEFLKKSDNLTKDTYQTIEKILMKMDQIHFLKIMKVIKKKISLKFKKIKIAK